MSDFNIKDWAEEYELSPETLNLLEDKGFISKKSLSKLSSDMVKTLFAKGLKPAQLLLLQDAVDSLQPSRSQEISDNPTAGTSRQTNNSQATVLAAEQRVQPTQFARANQHQEHLQRQLNEVGTLTAEDILKIVSGQDSQPTLDKSNQQHAGIQGTGGKAELFDPLAHDLRSVATSTKFRDIRDFISSKTKNAKGSNYSHDQDGVVNINGVDLVVKESKGPLENVKISQYMEASCRILRAMVLEDKAPLDQVMDYVGYMTKFSMLAQSFRWDSLMRYDYEYRKAQAEQGFKWGADSPYMMQLYLMPPSTIPDRSNSIRPQAAQRGTKPRKTPNKFNPASGQIICQKYNGRQGCSYTGCKYAHVCMTCYLDHPEIQHKPRDQTQGHPKHEGQG